MESYEPRFYWLEYPDKRLARCELFINGQLVYAAMSWSMDEVKKLYKNYIERLKRENN